MSKYCFLKNTLQSLSLLHFPLTSVWFLPLVWNTLVLIIPCAKRASTNFNNHSSVHWRPNCHIHWLLFSPHLPDHLLHSHCWVKTKNSAPISLTSFLVVPLPLPKCWCSSEQCLCLFFTRVISPILWLQLPFLWWDLQNDHPAWISPQNSRSHVAECLLEIGTWKASYRCQLSLWSSSCLHSLFSSSFYLLSKPEISYMIPISKRI